MNLRIFVAILLMFVCSYGVSQVQDSVDTSIVRDVDIIPQFQGGPRAWQRYLEKTVDIRTVIAEMDSTQYVDFGVRQTAVLEFTVCEDGEVCDVEILNKSKISPAFAKEAMQVMDRSPKWKPAIKDDKTVRTRFRQSITAILDEN